MAHFEAVTHPSGAFIKPYKYGLWLVGLLCFVLGARLWDAICRWPFRGRVRAFRPYFYDLPRPTVTLND